MKNEVNRQEDNQLVLQAAKGEPEAFRTIMDKYQTPVFTLCRRITASPQDAEDATQDTFFQLYRNLWRYKPGNGLRNWLYSIALNICRKQRRRNKIAGFLSLDRLWKRDGDDRAFEAPSPGPSIEQSAINREEKKVIENIISELPEPLKQPFVLRYFMNVPIDQIAETLGISAGNVRVRIHRAKMAAWTAFSRAGHTRSKPAGKGDARDAR